MWARVTKTYFEELEVSIKTTEPILKNSKLHRVIGEIFNSLPCQICQIAQNVYKNSSKVVKQNYVAFKEANKMSYKATLSSIKFKAHYFTQCAKGNFFNEEIKNLTGLRQMALTSDDNDPTLF